MAPVLSTILAVMLLICSVLALRLAPLTEAVLLLASLRWTFGASLFGWPVLTAMGATPRLGICLSVSEGETVTLP
jgi:hypothetical protein